MLLVSTASAQSVAATTDATGTTTILRPLTVVRTADLDFGSIIVAGAGTAVIDPVSGTMTTTGPLTVVGSAQQPASFTTTGSRNSIVLIRLPQQPVTLTRVGGTETMTVTNFTLDGPSNRRFPITQTFDFAVGARLNVAAGQADGSYLGSFTVTVQYP
ncbi:MAG TPA: DUF4402 domain-containing protein [Sphingomicrobium sp.]|jgi:hypothetical protein